VPKTRRIKKVTTSQDDGLLGVLKNIPVGWAKNRQDRDDKGKGNVHKKGVPNGGVFQS
jgi:hypothetical protein